MRFDTLPNGLPAIPMSHILDRCKRCGDCMVWQGHAHHGERPQIRINNHLFVVRRLVWGLVRGDLKPGHWIATSCGTRLCVHQDHLVQLTRGERNSRPLTMVHKMAIARARRARSRFSDETIAQIRLTPGSLAEVAEQFGCNVSYVSKLRLQQSRTDYTNHYVAGLVRPARAKG